MSDLLSSFWGKSEMKNGGDLPTGDAQADVPLARIFPACRRSSRIRPKP